MTVFIRSFEVDGFRAFRHLRIDTFGRVNIITGKNNSGKSSLLEAIRILATGAALRTIYDILSYREELGVASDTDKSYSPTDIAPFCNLFYGFPNLANSNQGFSISASGDLPSAVSKMNARISWYVRKTDPDRQAFSYELASGDLFDDADSFPALDIDIGGRKRVVAMDSLQRRAWTRGQPDENVNPCVYLDPFSSRTTGQMGALWDAIALTDAEPELVKALRVISDDIQAVSMIGSGHPSTRPRTAIVKSRRHASPLPLRSFGDGVNRLFGIILSLCNARNGVLLVDEIENGLHYSVQEGIWRTIFRLARDLNVQVFATSHSWDCVSAFQRAARESPEDGVLVRLTKKDGNATPTVFREEEMNIVTRDQVEVR